MILPKIPKKLSVLLENSNTWAFFDVSLLKFLPINSYLDYFILNRNVGLVAENDFPDKIIELGLVGQYLVKNKSDGRLLLYSEDRFRKLYPSVI